MPYKKRYGRRRKTYKKRRSWKKKVRKYTGQTGIRLLKLKRIVAMTTGVAGDFAFAINTRDPSSCQDWSASIALFDSYRSCAVKIKYLPQLPNDTSVTTGYLPLYVTYDTDDSAYGIVNVNAAIQYENLKVKNMYRPWNVYYKNPKISQNGSQLGYSDCDSPIQNGVINFTGTGFDSSTQYGTLVISYYLMFKNRR